MQCGWNRCSQNLLTGHFSNRWCDVGAGHPVLGRRLEPVPDEDGFFVVPPGVQHLPSSLQPQQSAIRRAHGVSFLLKNVLKVNGPLIPELQVLRSCCWGCVRIMLAVVHLMLTTAEVIHANSYSWPTIKRNYKHLPARIWAFAGSSRARQFCC